MKNKFTATQQDTIEDFLCENLPHGSGIDCKWEFNWLHNGKLQASNSFHCMNDVGYYDGFADFTLTFDVYKSLRAFRFVFNGNHAQRKNNQYMLREYLEDIIYFCLRAISLDQVVLDNV